METTAANTSIDGRCLRRILDHCSAFGRLTAPLADEPRARLESEVGRDLARLLLAALVGDHRSRRDALASV